MSRKKTEDTEQLSLFVETEPDWIHADVDIELRSAGSFKGTVSRGDGDCRVIDEDAPDEDLEQFAQWLKQQGQGG